MPFFTLLSGGRNVIMTLSSHLGSQVEVLSRGWWNNRLGVWIPNTVTIAQALDDLQISFM